MKAIKKYYATFPETMEKVVHTKLDSYMVEMGQHFVLARYSSRIGVAKNGASYMGRFFLLVWLEGEYASAPAALAISLN